MMPKRAQSLHEGLKLISFCPVCQVGYNPIEARILGERDDSQLLHVQCRNCANAILALVHFSAQGISSLGMVTDLTFDDVVRFRDESFVEADDVLRAHEFLKNDAALFQALS